MKTSSKHPNQPRPTDTDRDRRRRDEDDSDKRDQDDPKLRAARDRERARVLAIISSPAGRAHPALAGHVAFKMKMPRGAAIRFIAEMGALIAEPTDAATLADRIILAGRRARGEIATEPTAPPPLRLVRATAPEIIAAGKKRRGEIV